MAFAGGKAIALATSHTLSITATYLKERTKDDGDGAPAMDFDFADWKVTSDSIVGANEGVSNEQTVVDLIDAQLAMQPIEVVFDAAKPVTGAVPAGGWQPAAGAPFPATTGTAYITDISVEGGSEGSATASVTFEGASVLS